MVDRQLAFSILQLVALSLPAFAILLQMVVESDFPYTRNAIVITTVSMGLFLLAGIVILAGRLLTAPSTVAQIALGSLILGMVGLIFGSSLIGLQTEHAQQQHSDDNE